MNARRALALPTDTRPSARALRWVLLLILGAMCTVAEAGDGEADDAPPTSDEAPASTLHSLRYHYANDTFTATDYYFTQGMGLTWTSPLLARSPLAIPLPELDDDGPLHVSLLWRYEGFTPIDYDEREIQFGDRPFASYMYVGHRSERLTADGGASLSAQWSLGYMGPRVGAQQFQAEIHRLIDDDRPRGWRNQIDDDLVLQLEVGGTYRLFQHASLFDLRAELQLRGGTLYSDATAGLLLRFGLLGAPLGPPDHDPRFYLWARAEGRVVGFNATLQGGVFGDSVYTLSAHSVERLVGVAQSGITLEVGAFGLSFSTTFITPEFRGGRSHAWGQLGITVFFG